MSKMNVSDYPKLLSTILASQKMVYLFGAGASMTLGGHSLNWPNWILSGKAFLSLPEQSELDKRMGAWTSNELIDAATYLLGQLKASGSYHAFMDQTVGALHPVDTVFQDALRKVWRAGDLITTTNYDIQMEETLGAGGISYAVPAQILSIIRGTGDNKVIHLHGMYDRLNGIDDIIADDPQYQGILNDSGAQFIQNLISTYPIIIVGCGGTVEDPNLSGFMSFVVDKLRALDIPYFYLAKNGDALPDLPANAVPVFYGDEYSDLPAVLLELALIRLQRRVNLRSLVSVNPYQKHKAASSAFGRMHFANGFNPFVGRRTEMAALHAFINTSEKFSWWTVLGEGGIGKSRLVLEWLRSMPWNWFGFFAQKHASAVHQFTPFTDTVVVFDYILGQEAQCAETICEYLELFEGSPYRLRILLLERRQRKSDDDWLINLKREMPSHLRLDFESGQYGKPILTVDALEASDEVVYIENYLGEYLSLLPATDFVNDCKANKLDTSKRVWDAYRISVDTTCYRPLYLSVFIEVWLAKEGHINFSSTEDLLAEYLNKEKNRWRLVLGDDGLVDSYLRILAVGCAIGHFNITDVYGNNYLEIDCKKLTVFLDDKSGKPGADNLFEDLFISMDELVEDEEDYTLLETFLHPEDGADCDTESVALIKSLKQDERFAYFSPYIKLQADPQEMYLQMLVNADAATDEECEELSRVREARIQRVAALPNHAWIIEPVFPDIINAYIVSHTVNERDAQHFAKLARSNSVLGLSNFISLALEDWPENGIIQKIAVTPPDEMLNYFEYYVGVLSGIAVLKDLQTVETALLNSDPLFQRYELEIWKRIAIVLTDRNDMARLYESGLRLVEYLKDIAEIVPIREETAEVLEVYCVGLHNAEEVDKFSSILEKFCGIGQLLPDHQKIGLFLCKNYERLMHLKRYKGIAADIQSEWIKITELLKQYGYSEVMCKMAMSSAHEYMQTLISRNKSDELCELERTIDEIFRERNICEVAEVDALCLANILSGQGRIKTELDAYGKIKHFLEEFPNSMNIRAAFISVSNLVFSKTSDYRRVPDGIINNAKAWSIQYPGEIEFQEGYFGLLLSRLEYAQAQNLRNEQRRVFKEMKLVAERADYSEYGEQNQLLDTIRLLQQIYGY